MPLADILMAKGLVTREQIMAGVAHQKENSGRFGDALVATGVITAEKVEEILAETPEGPKSMGAAGVDPILLLQLMLKGMHTENLETTTQLALALQLPPPMIDRLLEEATKRKLVEVMGQMDTAGGGGRGEMRYALSQAGKAYANECLEINQYFGPAPVSLESWQERILAQKISNEHITREMLTEAFADLVIPERFLSRLGPAVNSGTAILIYGPAGNGKTTVAEIVGDIFKNVVYVPYCIEADGQIIKVFDPTVHQRIEKAIPEGEEASSLRRENIDKRWVPCYRPMVITGGELTLEMLDLKFNEDAKFYEAPLHIKALNGTFLIDDFGRQKVAPEDILNRWIVPLNSRVDYLNLHTGKSIQIPFDEMVIFSTNLHPNDLMDPAFQRRIAYKLETIEPPEDLFRKVFEGMAKKAGLELTDETYGQVMDVIRKNEAPLAYFQPKFIVEQVLATCKFEGTEPHFTPDNIEDALANLYIKEADGTMFGVAKGGK
ncbi:MAG: ATPase [Alphaproteobacteria bacterium]|nr:ATPase [Alphaproteobacteria bacterium]MBT4086644.1 ATPase [Alphaproteobacteria bacterium]MBT7744473.1 ATPase [Alphaproteobacteria bacterium]